MTKPTYKLASQPYVTSQSPILSLILMCLLRRRPLLLQQSLLPSAFNNIPLRLSVLRVIGSHRFQSHVVFKRAWSSLVTRNGQPYAFLFQHLSIAMQRFDAVYVCNALMQYTFWVVWEDNRRKSTINSISGFFLFFS